MGSEDANSQANLQSFMPTACCGCFGYGCCSLRRGVCVIALFYLFEVMVNLVFNIGVGFLILNVYLCIQTGYQALFYTLLRTNLQLLICYFIVRGALKAKPKLIQTASTLHLPLILIDITVLLIVFVHQGDDLSTYYKCSVPMDSATKMIYNLWAWMNIGESLLAFVYMPCIAFHLFSYAWRLQHKPLTLTSTDDEKLFVQIMDIYSLNPADSDCTKDVVVEVKGLFS